jgi:UDPglucose 6-dehydrogenase
MKVLVIGAGFVGLTTACVLASTGVTVFLEDTDKKKLDLIFEGKAPFFEEGLGELLEQSLNNQKLQPYNWKIQPDLTFITVGTPSLANGSIDLSFVSQALAKCNKNLKPNSLVAIKSTVIPGTTREFQGMAIAKNLELLMIPEFLREGSAVKDALHPDRIVIGARSSEIAQTVATLLGITSQQLIITTTYSAESIKYISNSFLAACISFTNDVFSNFNHDPDYQVDDILLGWHSDKRFSADNHGDIGLIQYLIPGPGFGGSCFPKDIRALQHSFMTSGNPSSIVDGVVLVNQKIVELASTWIESIIPESEKFVIFGMAFKDGTDDIRESPSVSLVSAFTRITPNGYWVDQFIKNQTDIFGLKPATAIEEIIDVDFVILMHHDEYYRKLIQDQVKKRGTDKKLKVLAMRNQKPIDGTIWLRPRQKEAGLNNEF